MRLNTPEKSVSLDFKAYTSAHMFADNGAKTPESRPRLQEVTPTLMQDRATAMALSAC